MALFEKGRAKTGGRTKASTKRKSTRLIDQLADNGFDYVKELANCLKEPSSLATMKYLELKALLPYMAPKLKETAVDLKDPVEVTPEQEAISDEALLKQMEDEANRKTNGKANPRTASVKTVAEGPSELPVEASTETDLQNLAGIEEEN